MHSTIDQTVSGTKPRRAAPASPFGEADAWRSVGAGWAQLYGSFQNLGVSFEWHDFSCEQHLDWGRSFHPGSLEICLNLAGRGRLVHDGQQVDYAALTCGFYCRADTPIEAQRFGPDRHQFITLECSPVFLTRHLTEYEAALHPLVRDIIDGKLRTGLSLANRLTHRQQQLMVSLKKPPVLAAAQSLWYTSKALELLVEFLFQPSPSEELFCARQQRLARDRVESVVAILKKDLTAPPNLEQIGKEAGCSPFYLSRIFSKETGMTIPQYLRRLRMERAAELLKSGEYNVTETALEVGYSSLSHFSQAFHQEFGCCPGLYPLPGPLAKKKAAGLLLRP